MTFKNLSFISFFFSISLLLISCNDEESLMNIQCDTDALFDRTAATGTMFYLPCYESWAIKMDEVNSEGSHLYAASLSIDESFKQDDLRVKFSGCFYPFDLPLIIPDPTIWGEMYVVQHFEIIEDK